MVGPDLNQILMLMVSRLPFWLVILFGAFLCLRHAGRKPREVRLVGIALALMVAGAFVSMMMVPIVQALGLNMMGGQIVWWLISAIASLPHTVALGILFLAIFGGLGIGEEPVFRYDDERQTSQSWVDS